MTAPTLTVAVISAGRVGTAVGERLERAGHRVIRVVAPSPGSRARAAARLPGALPATPEAAAAAAELTVLAVPDGQLAGIARRISAQVGPGRIVVHVAGALGREVLDPCERAGALTIAMHPAMTFTGLPGDTDRLDGCAWGVTAGDEVGTTVADLLAGQMGGRAIPVPEHGRTVYHAAMATAANLTSVVLADAMDMLAVALGPGELGSSGPRVGTAEATRALLGPLVHAAVDNTLDHGRGALTGPVARDDADTVGRHLAALEEVDARLAESYRAVSRLAAHRTGAPAVRRLLEG